MALKAEKQNPGSGFTKMLVILISKDEIFENFLDFAAPLVSKIDRNTTEYQIGKGFKVAYTVWNTIS